MKKYLVVCLIGLLFIIPFLPQALSLYSIPPTNAFVKIITSLGNYTSKSYAGVVTFVGNGITISTNQNTKTVYFNVTSTSSIVNVGFKNQTGNLGPTTLLNSTSNSMYRVSVFQEDTSVGTAGIMGTVITFTDETGTVQTQKPAADQSLTLLDGYSNGDIFINVKKNTNIKYTTTVAGVVGNPTYSIYITVEKLS